MIPHDEAPEHEFEAVRGLPQALPPGERMLWQGAPDWRVLARDVMHLRALSGYFAALLAWRAVSVFSDTGSLAQSALAVLWPAPLALVAIGLLALIAWIIGRTTVYTVTDKRVVMRIGMVLSITFNLPYSRIESASLRTNRDGSGDVCLLLGAADRIGYAHLWPHARPWQLKRTQPALRGLADVVASHADPLALIAACDEVWTMTSLLGFEALLRSKPVTCLGAPFYAGWGLTRDLGPVPLRRRQAKDGHALPRPDLDALTHAALIGYPRCFDPVSGRPCPPEVVVARLADGHMPARSLRLRLLAKAQGLLASRAHLWR